jgi:hypothetical protein
VKTAHILWPDEQAFIGTCRPMLVEEIVQKDDSITQSVVISRQGSFRFGAA